MTNELLAEYIQQGENDELIPILWEKVRKLLYMKSSSFYNLHKEQCSQCGVETWDIKQGCYMAFLEAVKAFKADTGNKFTSYLEFPFKNVVHELLGIRTTKQEPLNISTSLDKPIENSEGDACSLSDTIEDESSIDFVNQIDEWSEAETIRQIVDTLSEPYKSIIKAYFFEGIKLPAIGERNGYSTSRAGQLYHKALRILRQNKELQQLYREQQRHYNWISLARFQYSPEYYKVIEQAKEKPLSYGQRQADINTSFINWKLKNAEKQS